MLLGAFAIALALVHLLDRTLPRDSFSARVTERSNHRQPARQIGGLAVVPAVLIMLVVAGWGKGIAWLDGLVIGALLLMIVGAADDRHDLTPAQKLAGQAVAAGIAVTLAGPHFHPFGEALPPVLQSLGAALLLVWFANMVNVMDGLDLMVVSGIGVPHLLLALFGLWAFIDPGAVMISASLAGALLAFAIVNWPPARVFLGDGGSLPIGFLTGAVVLLVAREHPIAALLPFPYFFADSISTVLFRLAAGENILRAHSQHAYQRVRRAGRSVPWIVSRVALSGAACTGFAAAAMLVEGWPLRLLCAAGAVVVAIVLTLHLRRSAS